MAAPHPAGVAHAAAHVAATTEPAHVTAAHAADMAAAHDELKVLADAVVAAEKASPNPIAPQGVAAIKLGRSIWTPAEEKTSRELARAWLSWGMPDRCDATARTLAANSALLGKALSYNNPSATDTPPAPATTEATPAEAPPPAEAATGVAAPPAEMAPAPCTARAAISSHALVLKPPTSEASANSAMPSR